MFRSHRKLVSLILSMIILNSLISITIIEGKGLVVEYDQPSVAIVIDVIDGEAIKVMHIYNKATKPTIELIRLIGVDSMANDETYAYVKDQLLGKPVFILYDENYLPVIDDYINAYVFANTDQTFNETLLTYGYAKLDTSFSHATYYDDLVNAEFFAIRQEKGIHKTSTTPSNIININLASSTVLQEHFGVSPLLASAIVSYRLRNPINNSKELGFIHEEIDREFIINQRASIHYTTNINDATLYELTSLFPSSNGLNMANDVNRDRVFNPYNDVEDLKSLSSVSGYYTIIEPYISTKINDNLYVDKDLLVVNVNTATSSELVKATSMSSYNADKIVDQREKTGYVYKSLEELTKPNFPLMNLNIDSYLDNLTFSTEINKASDYELLTLFSSFDLNDEYKKNIIKKINYNKPFYNYKDLASVIGMTFYEILEPFIYIEGVEKLDNVPINVNSSKKEDLVSYLNITGNNKTKVLNRKTDYTTPYELTFINSEDMEMITLYTNVNNASYNELLNLNRYMTPTVANAIIEYRSYYPFYSLVELKEVLSELKKLYLYELIKNEIVFY